MTRATHWRRVLELGLRDAGLEERIREATRRGHPQGDGGFMEASGLGSGAGREPASAGTTAEASPVGADRNGVIGLDGPRFTSPQESPAVTVALK